MEIEDAITTGNKYHSTYDLKYPKSYGLTQII